MRFPIGFAALALLALSTACSTTSASASDDPAKMQAEMMEKMAKFGTPGDEHKVLQKKVGRWNWTMKHWMTADSPAQEMSGTTETNWVMDGRFVEDKTRSTFEGMPFEGRGFAGFDKITEKYTFFWFDNMSTGFMTGEGTWDPSTKTFTWQTNGSNPMTGEECKGWSKEKFISDDHWVAEFHGPDMNGREYKAMEMTMTRAR